MIFRPLKFLGVDAVVALGRQPLGGCQPEAPARGDCAEHDVEVERTFELSEDGRHHSEHVSSITWKWMDGKLCQILQTTTTITPPPDMTHREQREIYEEWRRGSPRGTIPPFWVATTGDDAPLDCNDVR